MIGKNSDTVIDVIGGRRLSNVNRLNGIDAIDAKLIAEAIALLELRKD